ncbi:bifunctional DNA primase/polymerase [Phytoactinopolyspora mesophila]|uniref:DNA primase/polymerase bifunctional N-terminal domain-containing protein n=1 Tax=Phytoactinopolyspora mesophila TaxID=2650750 RepID=A0A7K3M5U6_9ACTN|nr:bifunctional DNA primase/polymerase [Phytoactinopolyspora mesophila]NDL58615.1 hypothetical protein [Phytoactinopolyspora mesophila]
MPDQEAISVTWQDLHVTDSMSSIDAAAYYATLGLKVFPTCAPIFDNDGNCVGCTCYKNKQCRVDNDGECTSIGKCPMVKYTVDASDDAQTVMNMFTRASVDGVEPNVGVLMGEPLSLLGEDGETRSEAILQLIDCDSEEIINGDQVETIDGELVFLNFCAQLGLRGESPPDTLIGISGSGNPHYYILHTGSERAKTANRWKRCVDVKGWHQYGVVSPSVHASGRRYQWKRAKPPAAPGPLLARALETATPDWKAANGSHRRGRLRDLDTGGLPRAVDIIAHGAPVGLRDEAANKVAHGCRLNGISEDDAKELVTQAWQKFDQPEGKPHRIEAALAKVGYVYGNPLIKPRPDATGRFEEIAFTAEELEAVKAAQAAGYGRREKGSFQKNDDHVVLDPDTQRLIEQGRQEKFIMKGLYLIPLICGCLVWRDDPTVDPWLVKGETCGCVLNPSPSQDDRSTKPEVDVTNHKQAADWLADELGKNGLSGFFLRGSDLTYTPMEGENGYKNPRSDEKHDGPAQFKVVEKSAPILSKIRGSYKTFAVQKIPKEDREPNGPKVIYQARLFPADSVAHVIGIPEELPNLRYLRGVTHTPIIRSNGTVLSEPGYDDATGLLYLPNRGLQMEEIPEVPTKVEVKESAALIHEAIGEFKFVSQDHYANTVGLLLTPLLRELVPPPYKLAVIHASNSGSGKGYLAGISESLHGQVFRAASVLTNNRESDDSVFSILRTTTAPVVLFDNFRSEKPLSNHVIEALLTKATYSGRVKGVSENESFANDRLWMITANNLKYGGDLKRRLLWVDLVQQKNRKFTHDLPVWVARNRAGLLRALLTLVRHWYVSGAELAELRGSQDDYTNWIRTVQGILDACGIEGRFGDGEPTTGTNGSGQDAEAEGWTAFIHALYERLGSQAWTVKDALSLFEFVPGMPGSSGGLSQELLPDDELQQLALDKSLLSVSQKLGNRIRDRAKVDFGGLAFVQMVDVKVRRGAKSYKILKTDSPEFEDLLRSSQETDADA